jgi:hypothetical protein
MGDQYPLVGHRLNQFHGVMCIHSYQKHALVQNGAFTKLRDLRGKLACLLGDNEAPT